MTDENLKKYVDDFFKDLQLYDDYVNGHNYKGLLTAAIDVFLEYESNYTAFEVYQTFFMIYQITPEDKSEEKKKSCDIVSEPNTLLDLVTIMKKYEENTGDLIERQRDHFIHSVNVFLLGLAVYSQNKYYREVFRNYIEESKYDKFYKTADNQFSDEEFLYRWGIASLFHDIGYPFEIIGKQLNKFIGDSVKSISNTYDVNVGIDFEDFDEFNSIVNIDFDFADKYRSNYNKSKIINLFKPTELMAHKIAFNFDFDKKTYVDLLKHLNSFILYMKENNFIDHGFFSAILVLNSYGKLIQKYAKDYDFFFYPIVDSATAILLHNYYNKTLQKEPFNLEQLKVDSYPIAYLLILCDELQEWNRQPFGIIDREKSHVNDLIIEIDDNRMLVKYVLNGGAMGLGFDKEKKKTIYKVLDIDSTIFREDLSVRIVYDSDFEKQTMLDMDISDIDAQNLLLKNIEKLAKKINMQYNDTKDDKFEVKKDNVKIEDERETELFNALSSDLKLSNIRQARSIPKKLDMIGCEIAVKEDERNPITEFLDKEIIDLAKFEHKEWMEEKEGIGWTYGETKDEKLHETPYLVPWEELDSKTRQYDIDAVKNIPYLLDSIGLKVVRSKIRLLTFEMHKYYLKETGIKTIKVGNKSKRVNNCTSKELFDVLPNHVQYSNYKQANFIVKILKERKYELVDLSDKRDKVEEFSDEDLKYFAKREHKNWYKLRVNLGWTYGTEGEDKTSPNLVPWDDLDDNVKNANRRTFENLPKMCDEPSIQLKIVRDE